MLHDGRAVEHKETRKGITETGLTIQGVGFSIIFSLVFLLHG